MRNRITWEDADVSGLEAEITGLRCRAAFALTAFQVASGAGAIRRADQDRVRDGVDRAARGQRQAGAARREGLEEQVNKKGGLLGRPVKLVFYDDESNPSTVPGIYTKLLTSTRSTSSLVLRRPA